MTQELLDIFTGIAEDEGWSVDDLQDGDVELSYYSPAGEDFNMVLDFSECESLYDIVKVIMGYWIGYDPDYEATLWIGEDGHGRNGAPYHIADIVKDKEYTAHKIIELWQAVADVAEVCQEDAKAYIVYRSIVGKNTFRKDFYSAYHGKYNSESEFCEKYFSEIGDNNNSVAWDDRVREFFGTSNFRYVQGFVFEGV